MAYDVTKIMEENAKLRTERDAAMLQVKELLKILEAAMDVIASDPNHDISLMASLEFVRRCYIKNRKPASSGKKVQG